MRFEASSTYVRRVLTSSDLRTKSPGHRDIRTQMSASTSGTVTVGVPTYSRPDLLRRALNAITSQTYTDLDIIISDNASPDTETKSVISYFASLDSRVRFKSNDTNIGATANVMSLVHFATGKYFMWAADDDDWSPIYIEEMVRILNDNPAAAVAFCETEYFDDNVIFPHFPQGNILRQTSNRTPIQLIRQSIVDNYGEIFYGVYRTSALIGNGGVNFEARDFIAATTKAMCAGDAVVSPAYLFRKKVTLPVFLWTYVCAKKRTGVIVDDIETMIAARGDRRIWSIKSVYGTSRWFLNYYISFNLIISRLIFTRSHRIYARTVLTFHLFKNWAWTISQKDYSRVR